MKQRLATLLGTLVLVPLSAFWDAAAQSPDRIMVTFGEWTVGCMIPEKGAKICELVHVQTAQGQADPVGQVIFSRVAENQPLRMYVQTPPNAWIETGVKLMLDQKLPVAVASFRWCDANRCHAEGNISSQALQTLRSHTEPGIVAYKGSDEADIATSVSFRGFGAALAFMEKQ